MIDRSSIANWGRIVGGLLVVAVGVAKITGVFVHGLAGHSVPSLAILALWPLALAGGLSLMKDGISDLRRRQTPQTR